MGQTKSSKLSPQLRAALDELSLKTPNPARCFKCSGTIATVDAQVWLYGSDERWSLKVPLCTACNAIPGDFAA